MPIAVLKFSLDKLNVPCVLSVNGNNPKESSNIRVFSENKNEIINSSSQNISQKILNSGFYTIEYTVANLGGTSTKIDSFIVFENSIINDFWEVKLKELPVKIRKANAEKIDNQATFLFIYEKISRISKKLLYG